MKRISKKDVEKEARLVKATAEVLDREDAIRQKTEKLQSRFLGRPMATFDVEDIRKVYVPCRYYVYDFEIHRKTFFNRSGCLDRRGRIAIIFDCNEVHPFEFDLEEEGDLKLENCDAAAGILLPENCTPGEAEERVVSRIQNKVLRRVYAGAGDLSPVKCSAFYRPAWEMAVRYQGSGTLNMRYAWTDQYSVENEHILGLKVRLDNTL